MNDLHREQRLLIQLNYWNFISLFRNDRIVIYCTFQHTLSNLDLKSSSLFFPLWLAVAPLTTNSQSSGSVAVARVSNISLSPNQFEQQWLHPNMKQTRPALHERAIFYLKCNQRRGRWFLWFCCMVAVKKQCVLQAVANDWCTTQAVLVQCFLVWQWPTRSIRAKRKIFVRYYKNIGQLQRCRWTRPVTILEKIYMNSFMARIDILSYCSCRLPETNKNWHIDRFWD